MANLYKLKVRIKVQCLEVKKRIPFLSSKGRTVGEVLALIGQMSGFRFPEPVVSGQNDGNKFVTQY